MAFGDNKYEEFQKKAKQSKKKFITNLFTDSVSISVGSHTLQCLGQSRRPRSLDTKTKKKVVERTSRVKSNTIVQWKQ